MTYINLKIFIIAIVLTTPLLSQNSEIIQKHLNYLGSDLFEGRGTGTVGGELSAKYIALFLDKYELSPVGSKNTFYQHIPMHGTKAKVNSRIILSSKDTLKLNKDILFYHLGGRIIPSKEVECVFVGYGIIANEFNYNDYKDINVEGKIVVYLEGEPSSSNPNYFAGSNLTNYGFADAKQKIAISRGAIGTIEIPIHKCQTEKDWKRLKGEFTFEDVSLAYLPTPIMSIIINPKSVSKLFTHSGLSINILKQQMRQNTVSSTNLNVKVKVERSYSRRDFVAPNILGMLMGNDNKLKNEYVVLSAHYDHLGIGSTIKGDSIYNGVLDNALGVAGLLELARIFGENKSKLKRSVIFLFTTGEEKGLIGASYFVEHLPVNKEQIVANVNIDGMAMYGDFQSIIGIGSEYSDLRKYLKIIAADNSLKVEQIPNNFNSYESFLRSDQLVFALAGIPSILISDGLEYENISRMEAISRWKYYIHRIYHSPFDDLTQDINIKATMKHIKIIKDFVLQIANTEEKIKWTEKSPFQR